MRALGMAILALTLTQGVASANDASLPDGITGNWNGERDSLKNQGLQFQVKGIFEGAANASGGDKRTATGAGEFDFAVLADLGELIGDDGGSLEAKITDRFGANLVTAAGFDSLMQVQEIWGRGDIWRLSQLSYEQNLFAKTLSIQLGRLNPGADFDVLPCNFENLTFCGAVPGNIDGDYWFNSPVSQWGGLVKAKVGEDVTLSAGVYQVNPVNLTRGFTFDFSGGEGALIPFEVEWKPSTLFALPGDYQLGGWYSDTRGPDVFRDLNGDPLAVTGLPALLDRGRSGFFLAARQQVLGEAPPKDAPPGTDGAGLTLFLNYTLSDRRTSTIDRQFAIGAIYKGAIPSRKDDEIALAFGATHVNSRVAEGEQLYDTAGLVPFMPVQHSEFSGELDYRAAIGSGIGLTPNVQYIADPGGVSSRGPLFIFGLKSQLAL